MDNSLLECINLSQNTLGENAVSIIENPRLTKPRYPQPNDFFAHLDRVDNSLLECINLAENTLNAKEHDAPKAKFNQDFDSLMSGLDNTDPLNSDYIQINPEFLDLNDDREFIDYINSLDNPDNFDDLDDWSDDVDLFMERLCNPDIIDGL